MVVTELAEVSIAYYVGELVLTSALPIAGLILLIVGLRRQFRARQPAPDRPPSEFQPTPPQYYPRHAKAPRPPRSGIALIVVGSLLLAGSLLGVISGAADLVSQHRDSSPSLAVGQCITQSSVRAGNTVPAARDCSEPDATLEVAATGGGSATCPDGKLKDSQYSVLVDRSTTLCFLLNFKQGHCYAADGTPENSTFTAAACEDSHPVVIQVVKRIDGNSDRALCPAGTRAVSYPQPARLYCLQPRRK